MLSESGIDMAARDPRSSARHRNSEDTGTFDEVLGTKEGEGGGRRAYLYTQEQGMVEYLLTHNDS